MCQNCCTEVGPVYQPYETATKANAQHFDAAESPEEARLVDEFRWALDELEAVVGELARRLKSVSRPRYEGPQTSDPVTEEAVSPARQELHRLHLLSGGVQATLALLEV